MEQGAIVDYLGMQWQQDEEGVTLNMDKHMKGIMEMEGKTKGKQADLEEKLEDDGVHNFRSVLAKVRWPVSPDEPSGISSLTQTSPQCLTWDHVRRLNLVVRALKKASDEGKAKIVLPKLDLTKIAGVTAFDASFAKEPGMKSQAGFVSFLTTTDVAHGEVPCALVEFQSATITRVVKSTLASESASLSTALDRQLYLLVQSLLQGEPVYDPEWRHTMVVPGILITDAKSLYDHLNTTGKIPKERQTMIDLLVARDLIESGALKLCWVPTMHMLADVLTKMMRPTEIFVKFREEQRYSLVRTSENQEKKQWRLQLRQGQRLRRKTRDKETLEKQRD